MPAQQKSLKEIVESVWDGTDRKELVLDGQKIKEISAEDAQFLITEFPHLEVLSLNECRLKSLKNLPSFPKLRVLLIQDNKITGEDPADFQTPVIQHAASLEHLLTAGNLIRDVECIRAIAAELSHLKSVDVELNPFATNDANQAYRDILFKVCPSLEVIDGKNRAGQEVDDDEEDETPMGDESDEGEYEDSCSEDDDESGGDADPKPRGPSVLGQFYYADLNDEDDEEDEDYNLMEDDAD